MNTIVGWDVCRRALLESVTLDLLSLSGRRKGKYLPLAMLVPIVGKPNENKKQHVGLQYDESLVIIDNKDFNNHSIDTSADSLNEISCI